MDKHTGFSRLVQQLSFKMSEGDRTAVEVRLEELDQMRPQRMEKTWPRIREAIVRWKDEITLINPAADLEAGRALNLALQNDDVNILADFFSTGPTSYLNTRRQS